MLDLTGEEQEITVTDSTVITKQSMGGGQGAPGGERRRNQTEITEKRQRNRMEIMLMTMQMQNRKILKTLMIQKRQMHLTTQKAVTQKRRKKHLTATIQTAKLRKTRGRSPGW